MFAKSISTKGGDVFRDEFSVAFDGTNDYLDTSADSSVVDSTYVFWLKSTETGANKGVFGHGATASGAFHFNYASNKPLLYLANGYYRFFNDTSAQDDGQWHFYAVVVDVSDISACKLYIDGIEQTVSSTTSTGSAPTGDWTGPLTISYDGNANYAECSISEFVWYNSLLNINQIKTIYNGREPYNHKEGIASNYLQAWYRMGDGAFDSFIGVYNGLIGNELNTTLASNLVTNGTFDADSNWTKGTGWSIGSGVATASSASGVLEQDVGAVTGKIYKVSLNVTSYTQGFLFIDIGNQSFTSVAIQTGLHELYITATGDTLKFYPLGFGGNVTTASIDNVKVQEVGGNVGIFNNMEALDIEGDTP